MTATMQPAVGRNAGIGASTTGLEKCLIFLTIVALPTENHFLFIPGFSLQFILFGIIAVYVLLNRFAQLLSTLSHPALLAAYVFLFTGFMVESTHDHASYDEVIRVAQMIIGAILLASLCRDLPALRIACYGYLAAGVWLSMLLFLTSYSTLSATTASNFNEASQLRERAFEDNPLQANLNNMAFGAGQAAIVALSWALRAQTSQSRILLIAVGLFCLTGSFLPLSRSGALITLLSSASVIYGYGLRHAKVVLIVAVVAVAILNVVPQAIWSRMSFSFEAQEGKVEGRASVYKASMAHLTDYFFTGVGSGNFWSHWGRRTEFASQSGRVSGAHNCFIQVTLYWGILGLMAFLFVLWQAYRCVPRFCNREAAALCILGLGVSLLLFSMVVHNVYAKEFSLGLGLLAGADRWIWPRGFVDASSNARTGRMLRAV